MMQLVDHLEIARDESERIAPDDTVGLLRVAEDEWINGDVRFSVSRLRRALLAFEEEFDAETVELGIAENPEDDDGFPILIMTAPDGSYRAIAVAPRGAGEGKALESDADEVITEEA